MIETAGRGRFGLESESHTAVRAAKVNTPNWAETFTASWPTHQCRWCCVRSHRGLSSDSMSVAGHGDDIESLLRRAERAILDARPREQIERLLKKLIERAEVGSRESSFAHRHLAEMHLEESPWNAALHLRRVIDADPDDDVAHALMGLCQALQGHYRMAASAFRRAVALEPTNPWYNHNLGHLLDVALENPDEAVHYLRKANRARPEQEEVGASLAHCLGRIGRCDEGIVLTRTLLSRHPKHDDLRSLLQWLERGAPKREIKVRPAPGPALRGVGLRQNLPPRVAFETEVRVAMSRAGCPANVVQRAVRMWTDFITASGIEHRGPHAPELAAIEYALARIDDLTLRQRDIALRHGVSASTLSNRYSAIRTVLHLEPNDQRYTVYTAK